MRPSCGCCTTAASPVPAEIANRPGLSAIAYRLGTFASFRHALLGELSRIPELAGLRTRASEDYSVTIIELWSAVADILTFYQNRLANEAFLGTTRQRDSVLRLVRLIDYQLRPGLAATTDVAFTLEPGARLTLPAGLRVQSVPGADEKPQVYETIEPLDADARLDRLRIVPRPVSNTPFASGSTEAAIAPDAAAVAAAQKLAPGDELIVFSGTSFEALAVKELRVEDDSLIVAWENPLRASFVAAGAGIGGAGVFQRGRTFRLFGYDAPASYVTMALKKKDDPTTAYLVQRATPFTLGGAEPVGGNNYLLLDGLYEGIVPGASMLVTAGSKTVRIEVTSVSQAQARRGQREGVVTRIGVKNAALSKAVSNIRTVVIHELIGPQLRWWSFAYDELVSSPDVYVPGRRCGWSEIEVGRTVAKEGFDPGTAIALDDVPVGRRIVLSDQAGSAPVSATVAGVSLIGRGIEIKADEKNSGLLRTLGLGPGQSRPATVLVSAVLDSQGVHLSNPKREMSVRIGSLPERIVSIRNANTSVAAIAIALQAAIRAALPDAPQFAKARVFGRKDHLIVVAGVPGERVSFGLTAADAGTVVALGLAAGQERFADAVLSAPISNAPLPAAGTLSVAYGLRKSRGVKVPAKANDQAMKGGDALKSALRNITGLLVDIDEEGRALVIPPIASPEGRDYLRLSLRSEAPLAFDSRTAVLAGNVARASHGQTAPAEIVGDGDASAAFQQFTLRKKPVTHLPGGAGSSVHSTLRVLVNGVRWREVPTLYGQGPRDEVYVTRTADDGTLHVQFGGAGRGARLPTGRGNVVAFYREGLGLEGRVRAGQLTTLLDRPTGLKKAVNWTAADGGAAPERFDAARRNAPATVRAFGRAVSLRDFEDVAMESGEVARALATWVWTGSERAVHLTIAGPGGAPFSPAGLARIHAALGTQRDPNRPLLIDNVRPVPIAIRARLRVSDAYVTDDVLTAARAALSAALSFVAVPFAGAVHLSDVYAILQATAGVVAVDVDELDYRTTDAEFRKRRAAVHGKLQPHLWMMPAHRGNGSAVSPAEQARIETPTDDVVLTATGGMARVG